MQVRQLELGIESGARAGDLNRLTNYSSGTLSISGGVASISGTATLTEGWTLDALGMDRVKGT